MRPGIPLLPFVINTHLKFFKNDTKSTRAVISALPLWQSVWISSQSDRVHVVTHLLRDIEVHYLIQSRVA